MLPSNPYKSNFLAGIFARQYSEQVFEWTLKAAHLTYDKSAGWEPESAFALSRASKLAALALRAYMDDGAGEESFKKVNFRHQCQILAAADQLGIFTGPRFLAQAQK